MEIAGFSIPAAVDLEVLNRNGDMASRDELLAFAERFKLKIVSVEAIIEYSQRTTSCVKVSV
jgi:3,4-dihydroxy-2-butanone 4-phosphate synthase